MSSIWRIYFVPNCCHITPPHDKLVIIVAKSPKPIGFFINTDIPAFIKNKQDLLVCQVPVLALDYECLQHKSYINCAKLLYFKESELTQPRDFIKIKTKNEIKTAVSSAITIEPNIRKLILSK